MVLSKIHRVSLPFSRKRLTLHRLINEIQFVCMNVYVKSLFEQIVSRQLSKKLSLPVSHDTLLRLVLSDTSDCCDVSLSSQLTILPLEKESVMAPTNQPLALLNGRDTKTVEDWLKTQPKLYVVARDGSNSYRAAITAASPDVVQVSDRFHLVQILFKTAKDALSRL